MESIYPLKRTPLYNTHLKYGAKMVNFSGWEMPIQYEGIRVEHLCVRNNAGLFDVSHMGRIDFKGYRTLEAVDYIITNNASKMNDGKVIYSLMCNPGGGIVDDITVYRINESHYFFCVNASNMEKDYDWIKKNNKENVTVSNLSNETGILALQGPRSEEILEKLVDINLKDLKIFWFKAGRINNKDI